MRRCLLWCAALVSVISMGNAAGMERQPQAAIRLAVESHLARETADLPGRVSYKVGEIDPQLSVPACRTLETFTAPGTRLWGNTNVGVRCTGSYPWSLYVPVEVHVFADVVQTARPIAPNQSLEAADLVVQPADLTLLPNGILTDTRLAVGKISSIGLAAGLPVRADMLRAPTVVQQGQAVKLLLRGRGFTVTSEGRALAGAADGQLVAVRVQSGHVVSGLARTGGVVELRP